jgi:hypothetical protein
MKRCWKKNILVTHNDHYNEHCDENFDDHHNDDNDKNNKTLKQCN